MSGTQKLVSIHLEIFLHRCAVLVSSHYFLTRLDDDAPAQRAPMIDDCRSGDDVH